MAATAWLLAHPERPARAGAHRASRSTRRSATAPTTSTSSAFGADFAYTLDGEVVGEIENETFSAIELKVTFHGVGVHPGLAKGKLVNPVKLAARFLESLPRGRALARDDRGQRGLRPSRTRSRAAPSRVTVTLILRDHDGDKLERHYELACAARRGGDRRASRGRAVTFARWDQYRNMREALDRVPHVVEAALEATRRAGLEPRLASIRGGTDGSRLTEMGLPDPEPVHRRQPVPLGARVGERAGHGDLGRHGGRAAAGRRRARRMKSRAQVVVDRRRRRRLLDPLLVDAPRLDGRRPRRAGRADERLDVPLRRARRPAPKLAEPDEDDDELGRAVPDARRGSRAWRRAGARSARCASPRPRERMEELSRQSGWAKTFGLPLELISAAEAQQLFPPMSDRRRPRRRLPAHRRLHRPVAAHLRARRGRSPAAAPRSTSSTRVTAHHRRARPRAAASSPTRARSRPRSS